MGKRFRKFAALVLASALVLQNGVVALADEGQPEGQTGELQTEAVTEKLTEAQTEAVTEKPTEAVTEKQTEAVTEKPTEAPTEKPTEAVTEKPTEAPTEKPTETPTEKPAEAVTEKPTEAPTEKQTEKTTETPKKDSENKKESSGKTEEETEEETETERSERENDGKKMTMSKLTGKLGQALPWLFVAESVDAPAELLEGQEVADGSEGGAVLEALKKFSVSLANAKSSSEVQVFNLYADENGTLDTAQLDDVYKNHVIDVTRQYCVVNVIADSADQALSFSGYEMTLSGTGVEYTEGTEPGDIIYNFAAMDDKGEKFVDYEGELSLGSSSRLQGTFLAPAAKVTVRAELAGAVYAKDVTVADFVTKVMQISFAVGREPVEESDSESGTAGSGSEESETSGETDPETAGLSESETSGETDPETVGMSESETSGETDPETAGMSESETSGETSTESSALQETEESESETDMQLTDGEPVVVEETEKDTSGKYSAEVKVQYNGTDLFALENYADSLPYFGLFRVDTPDAGEGSGSNPGTGTTPAPAEPNEPVFVKASKPVFTADSDTGLLAFDGLEPGTYTMKLVTDEAGTLLEGHPVLQAPVENIEIKSETASGGTGTPGGTTGSGSGTGTPGGTTGSGSGTGTPGGTTGSGSGETTPVSPVVLYLNYGSDAESTPEKPLTIPNGFYYKVTLQLKKELLDTSEKPKASSETFYADIFTDKEYTKKAVYTVEGTTAEENGGTGVAGAQNPIVISMYDSVGQVERDNATVLVVLKATSSPMTFYVAETDKAGKVIEEGTGELGLRYRRVRLQGVDTTTTPTSQTNMTGTVTVKCAAGQEPAATITNQLKPAVVKLGVLGKDGKHLEGVALVIKNSKGRIVKAFDTKSFQSGSDYLALEGVLPDGDYYLSEINAPAGYAPAEDIPFTVAEGTETVVDLTNTEAKTTSYSLTVNKQVYSGRYQVYARTDTTGTYAKNQTFYAALFRDVEHKVKVSNVQEIHMKGLTGTTTFTNLAHTQDGRTRTYYLAETDEYGEPLSSTSEHAIRYANDGAVQMDAHSKSVVMQNVYSSLPRGYRYTATLTISKRVTNAAGAALPVSETFYVGIFRKADFSDTPTIVSLALNNRSSASVRRRILLDNSVTYYFAEVDANGRRVDSSSFGYNISIDQPSMTISRGEDKSVTVTNQEKSSKVTLYLTKRVYKGTELQPVTETFYAGLFRDPQFTKLYTQPIPMNLKNQSELTLKLSLNLGTADKATIYLAEVDKNGNVIRNEQQFGYQIRVINPTAVFTRETPEIQTIFLNSVYGSATDDDWQQILTDENNIPSYGGGGGWGGGGSGWVGGNGEIDPTADTNAAQTGDETPIGLYIGLLAAAAVVLILLLVLRSRKKRK